MSALQKLCNIIQAEMALEPDQVYIYKNKFDIPPDQRLYVAVGINNCKPYSNITRYGQQALPLPGLAEYQTTNFLANVGIDVLSRSNLAMERKEEVILALGSHYSMQVQQATAMLIGKVSTAFVDLSEVEGTAIPYRFNISVNIQYKISKLKQIDYYDTFTKALKTEA